MKNFVITILCLSAFITTTIAQSKTVEKPVEEVEKKVVEKANSRPADKEADKDPFDDADLQTLAMQCVVLETEKGNIKLEMYPESAPETVRSFLNLVAIGGLDTTVFSRVVPGFIIQGGNLYTSEKLTDKLRWRAVKKIVDEPNQIRHEKGIISMARSEEPNSASTNFFILLSPATTLDGKFAAFGKVIEGIETVETINKMSVENEQPKYPVRIETAKVVTCVAKTVEPKTVEEKQPEIKTLEDTEDSN